jgi:ABC-2 type transport system permease protein
MAGIAGAGMGQAGERGAASLAPSGGAFSPLARAQYTALARMRWDAFRNSMRTTRGAIEAAASGLNYVLYGIMGLGITVGLGAGSYSMVSKGHLVVLPLLLWAVFLMWQMMPLVMASFQQQLDLSDLLRFPLGFPSFFLLHAIFGLIDSTTLLGSLGSFGIWAGATIADPRLSVWVALPLVLFGVFNVLLSRAIFGWLDRWLAKRKTREIVSMLFLLAMLSLQFLNPAVRGRHTPVRPSPEARAHIRRELIVASEVQRWLPPGLVELTIENGARRRPVQALGWLGAMSLWSVAVALILSVRLRAVHRGEYLSDAPRPAIEKRPRSRTPAGAMRAASLGGAIRGSNDRWGPIAAIIEKDLRTVMRSMSLIYSLGAPLVMVIIFASIIRGPRSGGFQLALPLCIAYALLGFTQLIYNNLGAEGMGIQLLLYSPTPMRTVLLAKNLFHAGLFCVIAVLAGFLAILRAGLPQPVWLAITAAWLVFALPAHLTAGNLFSLNMPHKLNLGRIGRQRGGQASALLGMLTQAGILGVGAAVAGLCLLFGVPWLATPILLVLAVPAFVVWLRVLANSDAIAMRRRDELITALAKVE